MNCSAAVTHPRGLRSDAALYPSQGRKELVLSIFRAKRGVKCSSKYTNKNVTFVKDGKKNL